MTNSPSKMNKRPTFRNKTDFEILELPKIKFFTDHQGNKIDKNGVYQDFNISLLT